MGAQPHLRRAHGDDGEEPRCLWRSFCSYSRRCRPERSHGEPRVHRSHVGRGHDVGDGAFIGCGWRWLGWRAGTGIGFAVERRQRRTVEQPDLDLGR